VRLSLKANDGFLAQCRGAVSVEFALVAIPLFGLIFAILETGLVLLFGLTIDNAAQDLARIIQTGQPQQAGVSSIDDLKSKFVCSPSGGLLPALIDCNRLFIDVRTATSFASADTSDSFYQYPVEYCPGSSNSIVVVRIAYAMPVFLPFLIGLNNSLFTSGTAGLVDNFPGFSGWNHLIADAAVFQNESFSTAGGSTSSTSASSSSPQNSSCS
jgi:Flp pilus assembly protein TadG